MRGKHNWKKFVGCFILVLALLASSITAGASNALPDGLNESEVADLALPEGGTDSPENEGTGTSGEEKTEDGGSAEGSSEENENTDVDITDDGVDINDAIVDGSENSTAGEGEEKENGVLSVFSDGTLGTLGDPFAAPAQRELFASNPSSLQSAISDASGFSGITTITVTASIQMTSTIAIAHSTNSDGAIIIQGASSGITLTSAPGQRHFSVGGWLAGANGPTLTFRDITLDGNNEGGGLALTNANLIGLRTEVVLGSGTVLTGLASAGEYADESPVIARQGTYLTMEAGAVITASTGNPSVVTVGGGGHSKSVYAEFRMDGGAITSNSSVPVSLILAGKFIMAGGSITENNTGTAGGGVSVGPIAIFEMTGGKISGNTAVAGAGIYATGFSKLFLMGGEVSENTITGSNGAGIYAGTGGQATGPEIIMENGFTIEENGFAERHDDNHGAGVYLESATLTMNGGKISHNGIASTGVGDVNRGGGVYVGGGSSLVMTGGEISDHRVSIATSTNEDVFVGSGGGIYLAADGSATIGGNAAVKDNSAAGNGGGIYLAAGSSAIIEGNASIAGNTAVGGGGGIYIDYGTSTALQGARVVVNGASITGNRASRGGGVYLRSTGTGNLSDARKATLHLEGAYITNNQAVRSSSSSTAGVGGGVYSYDGSLANVTGNDVTFSGNTADAGYESFSNDDPELAAAHDARFTGTLVLSNPPSAVVGKQYAYNNYDINYNKTAKPVVNAVYSGGAGNTITGTSSSFGSIKITMPDGTVVEPQASGSSWTYTLGTNDYVLKAGDIIRVSDKDILPIPDPFQRSDYTEVTVRQGTSTAKVNICDPDGNIIETVSQSLAYNLAAEYNGLTALLGNGFVLPGDLADTHDIYLMETVGEHGGKKQYAPTAVFSLDEKNMTINVYVISTVLKVEFDISDTLYFWVDETTGGDVKATEHGFSNGSELPLDVTLGGLYADSSTPGGLVFADPDPDIKLFLARQAGFVETANVRLVLNEDMNVLLGQLKGEYYNAATAIAGEAEYTLAGEYTRNTLPAEAKRPSLTLRFRFALNTDEYDKHVASVSGG